MAFEYDALPTWDELHSKVNHEELDPVEQFIYDYEPIGDNEGDDTEWRMHFQAAIAFNGSILACKKCGRKFKEGETDV